MGCAVSSLAGPDRSRAKKEVILLYFDDIMTEPEITALADFMTINIIMKIVITR